MNSSLAGIAAPIESRRAKNRKRRSSARIPKRKRELGLGNYRQVLECGGVPPLLCSSREIYHRMIGGVFSTLTVYHDDTRHSAAMNMAIDEALLEHAAVPSIRFYQWRSPALSFGYFGSFSDVATFAPARDLVRRWTGGGIVFHGDDLTYSIVIPVSDVAFGGSSILIYEKIHHALCDTLSASGKCAIVAGGVDPGHRRFAKRAAVTASGYNCFANPVRADVMIDGRKVAGAAQRRTRRGLLQQGSIQGVDLSNGLARRFARALSLNCTERDIHEKLLDRARKLAQQKYGSDSWLRMR